MYSIKEWHFSLKEQEYYTLLSDGFTVVAIVVVKAAQQQESLRGFFVMQWISMSGH